MQAEPPQNAEYLVAAYIVTTVILAGYWFLLWRKARKSALTLKSRVRLSGTAEPR